MTSNEASINDITLQYLTNKEFASKACKHVSTKIANIKTKDKKFYRKRVLALTKQLLTNTSQHEEGVVDLKELPTDISLLFNSYLKKSIEYFKTQDRVDILQEEYGDISDSNDMLAEVQNTTELFEQSQSNEDVKFLKNIQTQQMNTLDTFVSRTVVKKDKPEYPRKKSVNLTDPVLKNKGVRKKKNVGTKYEEEGNNKTQQKDKDNKKTTKANNSNQDKQEFKM